MKTTLARATAVALAVVGLSMAPAAATPASLELELPGTPVVSPIEGEPGGAEAEASFCQVVGWWWWCRAGK